MLQHGEVEVPDEKLRPVCRNSVPYFAAMPAKASHGLALESGSQATSKVDSLEAAIWLLNSFLICKMG